MTTDIFMSNVGSVNMKLEDEPGYWGFYLEGRLMWVSEALFREKVNVIISSA